MKQFACALLSETTEPEYDQLRVRVFVFPFCHTTNSLPAAKIFINKYLQVLSQQEILHFLAHIQVHNCISDIFISFF